MAKNPYRKPGAGEQKMSITTKLFLTGTCAEIYLLMIYHYYVRGTVSQLLRWHNTVLPALMWIGLAVLAAGLILLGVSRGKDCEKKGTVARILVGAGVFAAVVSPLVLHWYASVLTPLCVVVPVIMILSILWHLYDRECVYALIVLCSAAAVIWLCRKGVNVASRVMVVRAIAVVWLAAAAAATLLLRKIQAAHGVLKGAKLLPANADYLPIYVALAVSVLLVLAGMLSAVLAYYAMWAAAVAIFAMAVYYTVQQL